MSSIKIKQLFGPTVSTKGSAMIFDGTKNIWSNESNESLLIPSGNTSQRPTANNGSIRYNSELHQLEVVVNGSWVNIIVGGSGGVMVGSNNLSELTDVATARTNLGVTSTVDLKAGWIKTPSNLDAVEEKVITAVTGSGEAFTYGTTITPNAQSGTIVVRDSNGRASVATPTLDTHITTKKYVDDANALKANIASPTFTGTVSGITKAMVGLTNVDNTSDANKPVSTATQTALNLKANLAGATFTGAVLAPRFYAQENVDGVSLGIRLNGENGLRYGYRIDGAGNLLLGNYNATNGAFLGNSFYVTPNSAIVTNGWLVAPTNYVLVGMNNPVDGGITAGVPLLQVAGQTGARAAALFTMNDNSGTYVGFYRVGVGTIGRIHGDGGSGISYATTSDYRLKNTNGPYENSLDAIKQSKVYSGTWYSDPNSEPEPMMLAHEIAEYAPRAVYGEKDATSEIDVTDNDGNDLGKYPVPEHQTVDYSKLVPLLFAAVKDLTLKVEQLESEINILKGN